MFPKTTEFVTNNNMVIVPHPPYSQTWSLVISLCFPISKVKLKGWLLETVSDIQRELQAVRNSIKENDFHSAFGLWKK
jgi:hypothetical protein